MALSNYRQANGVMSRNRKEKIEDRLAEAAAGWVARLQSADATDQDRADFQCWLRAHPSHAAAYDEMSALWGSLKDAPVSLDGLKARRLSRTRVAGLAAVFGLIAVTSCMLGQFGLIDRWRADYYTDVGEVRSITLEDGTQVDLDTDTAIAVRYSAGERRIQLLRGQAFFDVAKNPLRPFIVDDGGLSATALGTHYSVQTSTGSLSQMVQVEEGFVEVKTGGSDTVLGAGDTIAVDRSGRATLAKADIANDSAWRYGKLVFSAAPLAKVAQTLSRYRHGRVVVLDAQAADRKVSGVFDLTNTDEALAIIESNLPVSVTRVTDMLVVIRSK
ncbi:FecR family protein [Rhizobium hainanense]|uniref:FecR family protein n=2 Tax=Rhizobium hainanense TaxID=52131 RepID=A0A1C3W189_9HYPH|nr:FecR family protein [Rhizobium hainanense]